LELPHACFAALAVERRSDSPWQRRVLERGEAESLAALVAADLARLLPGAPALDMAWLGAAFDPAELLRPGWPAHAGLLALAAPTPGNRGGRLIAVGAHEGRLPAASLQPDPAAAEGLLGVLPIVLFGAAEPVAEIGALMEQRLLDTGMADARTALALQEAFATPLEHVRFLSLHDLCAMTAMQYQHAGMQAVWQLIESALLAPEQPAWAQDLPGLCAVQQHADVLFMLDPTDTLAPRRGRQLQAVLAAHGIDSRRIEPTGPATASLQEQLQAVLDSSLH
jgi:hypothetical protein